LLYHPNEPTRAEIRGFWNLWFLTVMLSGLGAVFAGIGFAMLGSLLRKQRAQRQTLSMADLSEISGLR
jgi:hypothetical protein